MNHSGNANKMVGEDHIRDATKMVSDTPRTNGCLTAILDTYGYVHQGNCPQRWVNHSRELERELNAANQRIKRLEEAGDGLMKSINCGCPYGPSVFNCQTCTNSWDAWNKAKEAKP